MATKTGKTADPPVADENIPALSELKLPSVPNVENLLLSAHRRNMDTLSAANRIALEGAQAVAKRHMDIIQQIIADLSDTLRAVADPAESPNAKAAKQADLLKKAYELSMSNTRELSELIQHSSGEALDLLNRRFIEAVDEVTALFERPGAPKS